MAYQCGLPCLGLIEVVGWRAGKNKHGEILAISDLDLVEWRGREIIIVFDSDVRQTRRLLKLATSSLVNFIEGVYRPYASVTLPEILDQGRPALMIIWRCTG